VDPIIIALPVAILVTVAVSLGTKKMDEKHLEDCFKGLK
jgi:SSS family solute:Na+ symporter